MIETVAAIGLFVVVAVIGIVLGMSAGPEPTLEVRARPPAQASAFFVRDASAEVQLEILLARLEQHVRQERAAVETFHDAPSAESLRCSTSSPLN